LEGRYLVNSTLTSFYVQTMTECLQHCAQHCPLCGSVNAQVTDVENKRCFVFVGNDNAPNIITNNTVTFP